jgi:hypothetical protein
MKAFERYRPIPLIASRWLGQPQTMATRRGFSKWRKHGDISPSWRKLGRPLGTTRTADRKIIDTIGYVATDQNGLTSTTTRTVIVEARLMFHLRVDAGLSQSVAALISEEVLIAVPVDVARADQPSELFRLQLLAGQQPLQLSDDLVHAATPTTNPIPAAQPQDGSRPVTRPAIAGVHHGAYPTAA